MGRGWAGWLAGVVGALSLMSVADAADTVRIDTGALKGVTVQAVTSFKGVPYARPPVGVWRWRPPQRPDPWPGVRDAGGYGPICMQVVINDNGVGLQSASEDCLTLNVFTPQGAAGGAKTDGRLPVMVWIHGGGFINGSGGAALYDGTRLAEQGVVVVTLNYRLGRFGFFAHPAITAETPKTYLANYGLMDQIAALQWVRRNIAAFGGDPAKVTIFGESAGGMAVNRLMMIREARGLFRAAIVQSGLGRERGQTLAEAEADGAAFAKKLGVETGDPAALRAIPAGAIVGGGEIAIAAGEAPILDGRLLMEDPADAFGAGRVAKVPYLVGSNSMEIPAALASANFKRRVNLTAAQKAAVAAAYGSQSAYDAHIITDVVFGEPARTLAREHAISGHPTWLYRFSAVSAGAPKVLQGGAAHASDRQYVFQTLNASSWPTDARDAAVAETVDAYWVAFAKTLDPNAGATGGAHSRPRWPAYGSADRLMDFTDEGPRVIATPNAPVLDLIADSYRQGEPAR